jgi:lysozyme
MCVALGGCASSTSSQEETSTTSSDALDVCAGNDTLSGVDVSHHNDTVDWKKVKASGRTFSFARTSDGLTTPDTEFPTNWPAMKKAGLIRGAYQFFRPKRDPVQLADLMLKMIADNGGLEVGDLPPVLDLEVDDGVAADVIVQKSQTWLDRIESKIGVRPIIYTGNQMTPIIGTHFKDYTLWVAHYGVSCPRMPGGWTDWTIWQTGDKASVPGITTGGTDVDTFNGTSTDLESLRLKTAPAFKIDFNVNAAVIGGDRDGDATMGSMAR